MESSVELSVSKRGWSVMTASTLKPSENHEQEGRSKYLSHVKRAPSQLRVSRRRKGPPCACRRLSRPATHTAESLMSGPRRG